MPLTVVLDTNILVRAQITHTSWSARIFDSFLEQHFTLATSENILSEVTRTLHKPTVRALTGLSDGEIDEFILLLRSLAVLTMDLYEISAIENDPSDNKFLVCSIEADADYVVSLDNHLLVLKEFRLIDYFVKIVGVEHFIRILDI